MYGERDQLLDALQVLLDEATGLYLGLGTLCDADLEDLRLMYPEKGTPPGAGAGRPEGQWQEAFDRRRHRHLEFKKLTQEIERTRVRAIQWFNRAVVLGPGIFALKQQALVCVDDSPSDPDLSPWDSVRDCIAELLDSLHAARQRVAEQTPGAHSAPPMSDVLPKQSLGTRGPVADRERHLAILAAAEGAYLRSASTKPLLSVCQRLDRNRVPYLGRIFRAASNSKNPPGGWVEAHQRDPNPVRAKVCRSIEWIEEHVGPVEPRLRSKLFDRQ